MQADSMHVPRFDAVDTTDPDACVDFLQLALALPDVQRWKRFSHDLLEVAAGDRVLDIGCGTGADALALAQRVGASGQVVGVDLSEAMIAVARKHAAPRSLPLHFQRADIHKLPFPDGDFQRVRIDRVLHFLPEPARALREAARVLAPGGRMVITEPDWRRLTIEGGSAELTTAIIECGMAVQTGLDLLSLLRVAGLEPIASQASSLALHDYAAAARLFALQALASRAVAAGRIDAKDAVRWLRSLQQASTANRFRCTLGGTIAAGLKAAVAG